jgi:hypothetical protein
MNDKVDLLQQNVIYIKIKIQYGKCSFYMVTFVKIVM